MDAALLRVKKIIFWVSPRQCQRHATCVPEGTAQRANRADQAVYQQLKAAQEEERHKQSAASAEAERKKQQSGMRRYFGSGGSGSKA